MTLSGIYIGLIAYRLKHKIPLTDNMQKIMELTGGEVQPNDFYKGE